MRVRLFTLLMLLSLAACRESGEGAPAAPSAAPAQAPPSTSTPAAPIAVEPKAEAAPALEALLRSDDTLATALARLGVGQVVAVELEGAEGETAPGWHLFPGDPDRLVEVWLNEGGRPQALFVRGANSAWSRADGVRLGLTSIELQAINGRPFKFFGFEWDYGGAISDWRGGTLATDGGTRGPVILCPPEPYPQDYPAGDSEFPSDDPRVLANPAVVCEFGVNLDVAPPAPAQTPAR